MSTQMFVGKERLAGFEARFKILSSETLNGPLLPQVVVHKGNVKHLCVHFDSAAGSVQCRLHDERDFSFWFEFSIPLDALQNLARPRHDECHLLARLASRIQVDGRLCVLRDIAPISPRAKPVYALKPLPVRDDIAITVRRLCRKRGGLVIRAAYRYDPDMCWAQLVYRPPRRPS